MFKYNPSGLLCLILILMLFLAVYTVLAVCNNFLKYSVFIVKCVCNR